MNTFKHSRQDCNRAARRQSGVVLIVTLIVLIAMTLATIALVRSVDTGNLIAGNLAFKQGATRAGDSGTEAAVSWLATIAGTATSINDDPANGYYSTFVDLDATGNGTDPNRYLVDWDGNACNGSNLADPAHCLSPSPNTVNAGAGNTIQYIVDRLCYNHQGALISGNCPTIYSALPGESKGEKVVYGEPPDAGVFVEFYRIISRISGPRNTVSYIESIVYF